MINTGAAAAFALIAANTAAVSNLPSFRIVQIPPATGLVSTYLSETP